MIRFPKLFEPPQTRPTDAEKGPVTFLEWTCRGRRGEFNATMRIPERGTITAKVGRITGPWHPAFDHLAHREEPIVVARADAKPLMVLFREFAVPIRFKGSSGLDGTTYGLRVMSEWTQLELSWWGRVPEPWRPVVEIYELATSLLRPATNDWPRCQVR